MEVTIMAGTRVYRSFEVREGYGPEDGGQLLFESESRGKADEALEWLASHGTNVQLFGVKYDEGYGESVRLRALLKLKAA
jgi:hypothetical protein